LAQRGAVKAGSLTLSERRRLEIARALALDPTIVLLDEVMAGLNHTEVDEVISLVQKLHRQGFTFLVIEHNLKVVRAFATASSCSTSGRRSPTAVRRTCSPSRA
jgi:branched-chain amino acid transport system ATP-binding protein